VKALHRCLLCGDAQLERENAEFQRCPACGTLSRSSPDPERETPFPGDMYLHELTPGERRWLSIIAEHLPTGEQEVRIIDLGCGNGSFLAAARQHGWLCRGVERNPLLVGEARKLDIDVEEADLNHYTIDTEEPYNAARLWFVLEHIREPGRLLRNCIERLHPGGILCVAVPNDANWLMRALMRSPDDRFWEHPLHLHHYPPFGLERWIESLGMELVVGEADRPTELMREGTLPLRQTWQEAREKVPQLCRLFYRLGVGRSRELLFRKPVQ
jgi:SAM-dependent methyltransferase